VDDPPDLHGVGSGHHRRGCIEMGDPLLRADATTKEENETVLLTVCSGVILGHGSTPTGYLPAFSPSMPSELE